MSGERTQALLRLLNLACSPTFAGAVPGVLATPGWTVIGAFVHTGATSRLQAMVLVSQAALTARVRLYGPIGGAPAEVAGSLLSSVSTDEELVQSANLGSVLVRGQTYQVQVECTGGDLVTDFAVARYAQMGYV